MRSSRLQTFAALTWYEETIKFLFNFAAKTSEILLAAGLVVSTANFLTDGSVMRDNGALATAWAWAQALAIDSSFSITFFYVIQCIKYRDWIKTALYGVLTLLLAIVAGTITNIDTFSHAIHTSIASAMAQFGFNVKLLTTLRAITVIGFVMMSRLKNVSLKELHAPLASLSPSLPRRDGNPSPELRAEEVVRILPARLKTRKTPELLRTLNLVQQLGAVIAEEQEVRSRIPPVQLPGPTEPIQGTIETLEPDRSEAGQDERDTRLECAYKELRAEGKRISGRSLAARAHIHRTTSNRWLEAHQLEAT